MGLFRWDWRREVAGAKVFSVVACGFLGVAMGLFLAGRKEDCIICLLGAILFVLLAQFCLGVGWWEREGDESKEDS